MTEGNRPALSRRLPQSPGAPLWTLLGHSWLVPDENGGTRGPASAFLLVRGPVRPSAALDDRRRRTVPAILGSAVSGNLGRRFTRPGRLIRLQVVS